MKSLDQIFKMHIRSHLDYCDFIYHMPALKNNYTHDINLTDNMNSLESLQYQSALAVTGAWKGKALIVIKSMNNLVGRLCTIVGNLVV